CTLILLLVLLLPLQKKKEEVMNKKVISLMQNFVTKDMGPLANAIFEKRTLAVNLRVDEIIRIEGIQQALVFDNQYQPVSDTARTVNPTAFLSRFRQAADQDRAVWTRDNSLWFLQSIRAFDEIIGFILVEYSLADMKQSENLGLLTVTGLITVLMLILLRVSHILIQKIVLRPMNDLVDSMAEIRKGSYGGRVERIPGYEIGDLARGFNAMSQEIADSYQKIESQNRALTTTRDLLDNIINSMPVMLFTVDRHLAVLDWNLAAEARSDEFTEPAKGLPLDRALPLVASRATDLARAVDQKKAGKFNKVESCAGDSNYILDITVYPLDTEGPEAAVIIIDDITDTVRMETIMIQTEKMMSLGGLAAGMAHEINNPLAGMIQNAQVIRNRLLEDLPANRRAAEETGIDPDQARAYLEQREIPKLLEALRQSGKRASHIVRNMLAFSRQSGRGFTPEDLAGLIDTTIELAENDYDMKKKYDFRLLEIIREYEPGMEQVECQGNKIQQVILNILKNGAQAMAEGTPAAPGPDALPKKPCIIIRAWSEGEWACIDIQDNGPGMDAPTRRRVF
ncbi:MAG: HAMP domain-containing protein, partial [Chlorobiales bacterium]|nr:HAMP domain-containing protein [Chlorobiales bacterium]